MSRTRVASPIQILSLCYQQQLMTKLHMTTAAVCFHLKWFMIWITPRLSGNRASLLSLMDQLYSLKDSKYRILMSTLLAISSSNGNRWTQSQQELLPKIVCDHHTQIHTASAMSPAQQAAEGKLTGIWVSPFFKTLLSWKNQGRKCWYRRRTPRAPQWRIQRQKWMKTISTSYECCSRLVNFRLWTKLR